MDYSRPATTWAVVPDSEGNSMYACSTLCGVRLGYTIAQQENDDALSEFAIEEITQVRQVN